MTKVVNYHTTLVSDFSEIQEDILKVAVCDLSGIEHSKEHFSSAGEMKQRQLYPVRCIWILWI